MKSKADFPIIPFATPDEFEVWLEKNHESAPGVWMRIYKKGSGIPSITWAQAVPVALCFGWIDSLVNKYDEQSYIQKFTPRGPKSRWSKINTEHVTRLIKLGKMRPAGLATVEAAKKDGRWDKAYASPTTMDVPDEFLKLLEKNTKAKLFFETLNKSNKYAVAFMLHDAKKPETKERRMKKFIEMFERGEKLY